MTVAVPQTTTQVAELVASRASTERGVLARGLGRSYGDAAQSAGGLVISTAALTGVDLDPLTGVAQVGAGADLDALLRYFVPRGWFVPVTPGTRFATVGGAVAADVHGKNHHLDGALGAHVAWLELVDGRGEVHRLTPQGPDAEAFWVTVGGLGLTGVITRVGLRMRQVESAWVRVRTERSPNLEALMDRLREHDRSYRYTVAWIDVLARGSAFGRGVLSSGDHAGGAALVERHVRDPLAYSPRPRLVAPPLPFPAVRSGTAQLFDAIWYRKAPARGRDTVERLETFFYPLDGVRHWNRLYGPRGFLQYQFVVPDGREDVVELALRGIAATGPAFLGVLKRFGDADPAPLSFPRPGWTLAVDIPVPYGDATRLVSTLDGLDQAVADSGGAVYLVKDARCRPDLVSAMYPQLARWRAARDRLDPERRFVSDLSRRVGL